MWKTYGGKKVFEQYISNNKLEEFIEVVEDIENLEDMEIGRIISIDTPEILSMPGIKLENIIFETHTYEKRFRKYLDKYLKSVEFIVVPSQSFKTMICKEYENISDKVKVLSNFVLESKKSDETINLPKWNKTIFFYFGRMDENKNVSEVIEAFNECLKTNKNIILLLVGTMFDDKIMKYIDEYNLKQNIVILPPIGFDNVHMFLNTMKKEKGIAISASKGETYGLSVAEIISYQIPIILSNIDAHQELVDSDERITYELGDSGDLAVKMNDLLENYEEYEAIIKEYKENINEKKFLSEFKEIYG